MLYMLFILIENLWDIDVNVLSQTIEFSKSESYCIILICTGKMFLKNKILNKLTTIIVVLQQKNTSSVDSKNYQMTY